MNNNLNDSIIEQVKTARVEKTPLAITAGRSKLFYGNSVEAAPLDISGHRGIIEYQPSELVVTVRSGTKLSELESELRNNNQMLAFEPPQHSDNTTIGGVIACGLSGPRRVACGSARDFVLGTTVINGKAEKCRFGGQVMKNVAGYDASRLMAGAQGTLGILMDISLKVLPISQMEVSLKTQLDLKTAIIQTHQWLQQGMPVTATCYHRNSLYLRLSSTNSAVKRSVSTIAHLFECEEIENSFWSSIKDQTHDFFRTDSEHNHGATEQKLWRCSHFSNTEFYEESDKQLIEWNGALRWIYSGNNLQITADDHGGHATRYPINTTDTSTGDRSEHDIFQPLSPGLLKVHQRLKLAFDPDNILNPGRLYTAI